MSYNKLLSANQCAHVDTANTSTVPRMQHTCHENRSSNYEITKEHRIKGALQTTRDPNVPNNNTGIILSVIPVLILVMIYYSIRIENTDSIMYYYYCTFNIVML